MEERKMDPVQQEQADKEERIERGMYWALFIVAVFAVLAIYLYVGEFGTSLSSKQEVWGQFGDFFGGLFNPILSFLALMGVLLSLRSQSLQLRAARDEARAAFELQAEQTKIFRDQSRLIEQQKFESSFYGLLDLKSKIVQEIEIDAIHATNGYRPKGRESLRHLVNRYNADRVPVNLNYDESAACNRFKEYCKEMIGAAGGRLGEFVSSVELLLRYVDSYKRPSPLFGAVELITVGKLLGRDAEQDLKKFYADILVSLLSAEEVECLFLYLVGSDERELHGLASRYNLFRNLPLRKNYEKYRFREMSLI